MKSKWKMDKSYIQARVGKSNFTRIRKNYSVNLNNSPKKG